MTELSRCGGDLEQIWIKLVKCVDDFGGVVQQAVGFHVYVCPKINGFLTLAFNYCPISTPRNTFTLIKRN